MSNAFRERAAFSRPLSPACPVGRRQRGGLRVTVWLARPKLAEREPRGLAPPKLAEGEPRGLVPPKLVEGEPRGLVPPKLAEGEPRGLVPPKLAEGERRRAHSSVRRQ